MAISILSWSYCICNRSWQNHRSILPNFLVFAWFDTPEFNRLPCSNNEMYGDAVFAIRFRYQLAIFRMPLLIWLPRLLHAHVAYEIDTDKIIAAFFRISYCLLDLIRWIQSSAMIKQQDIRWCSFRWSIPLSFDYVWKWYIDTAISTPLYSCCIWISYIKNHHW